MLIRQNKYKKRGSKSISNIKKTGNLLSIIFEHRINENYKFK